MDLERKLRLSVFPPSSFGPASMCSLQGRRADMCRHFRGYQRCRCPVPCPQILAQSSRRGRGPDCHSFPDLTTFLHYRRAARFPGSNGSARCILAGRCHRWPSSARSLPCSQIHPREARLSLCSRPRGTRIHLLGRPPNSCAARLARCSLGYRSGDMFPRSAASSPYTSHDHRSAALCLRRCKDWQRTSRYFQPGFPPRSTSCR